MADGIDDGALPGPSGTAIKTDSPSAATNSVSFVNSRAEECQGLRQSFEDKKFDACQALNDLQEVKDLALAVDAQNLPLDELIRTLEVRRAELIRKESVAIAIVNEARSLGRKLRISDPESNAKATRLFTLVGEAKAYLDALREWASAEQNPSSRSRAGSNTSCIQSIDHTIWQSSPLNPPRTSISHESIVFRYDFVDPQSLAGPTGDFLHGPVAHEQTLNPSDRRLLPQTVGERRQSIQAAQDPSPAELNLDRRLPPQAVGERGQPSEAVRDFREPRSLANPSTPLNSASQHSNLLPLASPPSSQPRPPSRADLVQDLISFRNPPETANMQNALANNNPTQLPATSSSFRSFSDLHSLGRRARQVPKFGGDTKKFREWEQLFKVFVDDAPAPTIEKFNLLRTSLTGQARDAIAHLQWEESHYHIAEDILRERFGDSRLAQRSHIQEVDSLVDKGPVTNARLETFTNALALKIRALIALGVSFTELSTTTTQWVLRCLPFDLREKFIVKLAENKLVDPLVTDLEFMIKFLETTVKVRREAEWGTGGFPRGQRRYPPPSGPEPRYRGPYDPSRLPQTSNASSQRDYHSFFASNRQRQQSARPGGEGRGRTNGQTDDRSRQSRRTPTSNTPPNTGSNRQTPTPAFPPTVQTPSTQQTNQPTPSNINSQASARSCIFCDGSHESYRCRLLLSHAELVERIENQNGCVKCLKRNHNSTSCRDGPRSNCPVCNARHYLIMCPRSRADDSSYHIASSPVVNDSQGSLSTPGSVDEAEILLQTAVVWVESGSSRKLARILLDTGAHRSYLAAEIAQEIDSIPIAAVKTSIKTLGNAVSTLDTCVHRVTLRSRHDPTQAVTIECIETPTWDSSRLPMSLKKKTSLESSQS